MGDDLSVSANFVGFFLFYLNCCMLDKRTRSHVSICILLRLFVNVIYLHNFINFNSNNKQVEHYMLD